MARSAAEHRPRFRSDRHPLTGRPGPPGPALDALAAAIPRRHTNLRPFARVVIPASVLEEPAAAATMEGASLHLANAVARA